MYVSMYSMCVCSPDISMALFLKVLITVPSFLRRSGELRLSATFCFNRERTFRFGSETGRETQGDREREGMKTAQLAAVNHHRHRLTNLLCYITVCLEYRRKKKIQYSCFVYCLFSLFEFLMLCHCYVSLSCNLHFCISCVYVSLKKSSVWFGRVFHWGVLRCLAICQQETIRADTGAQAVW